MKKYKVWAQDIRDVYIIVEANSKDEAIDIAEGADGDEFIEEPNSGDWVVSRDKDLVEEV